MMLEITLSAEFVTPVDADTADSIEDGTIGNTIAAHVKNALPGTDDVQLTTYGGSFPGAYDYAGQPYVSANVFVPDDSLLGFDMAVANALKDAFAAHAPIHGVEVNDVRQSD